MLNSIKAKLVLFQVLKAVIYLAGFPLLLVLVKHEAVSVSGGVMGNADFGVNLLALGWAAVVVVQIVLAFAVKKKTVKAVVVAIVAFCIVIAPLVYTEFVIEKKFDEYEAKYADTDYEFDRFEIHANHPDDNFKEKIKDHDDDVNAFLSRYNIEMESEVYGGENTDLSEIINDVNSDLFLKGYSGRAHYIFGKDVGDAAYSMNGMYADGYVFGYAQASYVLETYYKVKAKYEEQGKDVNTELIAAISALNSDPNSDWSRYKQTAEYREAYVDGDSGDPKYAKNYYVTPERIDEILQAIAEKLGESPSISTLLNMLKGIMPEYAGLFDLDNLDYEALIPVLEGFGLSESDLLGLLEGYSNYQSPSTYPVFFFIDDSDLRDYAYAKYFAEVHGAKMGSVLVGARVGEVTMSENGEEPMEEADLLDFLNRTKIENEYMPELYPFLVIRGYLFIFCGIVPMSLILAYLLAILEKREYEKLTVKEGER